LQIAFSDKAALVEINLKCVPKHEGVGYLEVSSFFCVYS